jgi:branched-chain amino acid transport system ATP-binding protein
MTMLEVRNLSVNYGQHRALDDVSVRVDTGEIVVILGANGAGKSTLLRAIGGICDGHSGGIVEMDRHPILGLTADQIVDCGIALVPEGRGIFGDLSVAENLRLGAYSQRARNDEAVNFDRVMNLFPKLGERKGQIARTMSGGEQQMVAIGRAMMSNPKILMLDEPSLGLSPLLCKELFANLSEVRKSGIGILLVEQNARQSLAIADRGYLLENAHIIHEDRAANLVNDPAVQKAYLGAGAAKTAVLSVPVTATDGPSPSDIAAQAMAAFNKIPPEPATAQPAALLPRRPVDVGGPALRRSADELAGMSIDALVQSASSQASKGREPLVDTPRQTREKVYVAPPPAPMPHQKSRVDAPRSIPTTQNTTSHDDRLRAALDDIERAAARARNSARPRTRR